MFLSGTETASSKETSLGWSVERRWHVLMKRGQACYHYAVCMCMFYSLNVDFLIFKLGILLSDAEVEL